VKRVVGQIQEHSLGFALKENDFSDVTLVARSKEFKAHKVILAVQSSVFRAVFESEMMEGKSNRVEIDDREEEIMEEMLTFIYTGLILTKWHASYSFQQTNTSWTIQTDVRGGIVQRCES